MNLPEPDHVRELRSVLQRFVLEKAPREKRREWDRTHTFPRDLFRQLATDGFARARVDGETGRERFVFIATSDLEGQWMPARSKNCFTTSHCWTVKCAMLRA